MGPPGCDGDANNDQNEDVTCRGTGTAPVCARMDRFSGFSVVPSLEAYRWLKASMQRCSWKAGWRSLLLREYRDPPATDRKRTRLNSRHSCASRMTYSA